MKPISLSVSTNSITVVLSLGSAPKTIRREAIFFKEAIELIKQKNWDEFCCLIKNVDETCKFFHGRVAVYQDSVSYNGTPISGFITERIISLSKNGLPFEPYAKFLDLLMKNPSQDARADLFAFIDHNHIPIDEDGYILGYKKVQDNYNSFHKNPDGTCNINKVGAKISMPRKDVDGNRNVACSSGLHFCAFSYLNNYMTYENSRVMVVRVSPENVVAFPRDYGLSKVRCCEYEVVAEINEKNKNIIENNLMASVNKDGKTISFYNHRDDLGRFTKANTGV